MTQCSRSECQTTAGCQCRKPFSVNFTWGHVKDLQTKEIANLKHDIGRYIAINSELATECESLRLALSNARIEARREALEQAAQLVEGHGWEKIVWEETTSDMLENVASAIRAIARAALQEATND